MRNDVLHRNRVSGQKYDFRTQYEDRAPKKRPLPTFAPAPAETHFRPSHDERKQAARTPLRVRTVETGRIVRAGRHGIVSVAKGSETVRPGADGLPAARHTPAHTRHGKSDDRHRLLSARPRGRPPARDGNTATTKKEMLSHLLSAVWTRLELATSCVTGRHSNQLNYHTVCFRNRSVFLSDCDAKIRRFFYSPKSGTTFLSFFCSRSDGWRKMEKLTLP